MNSGFGCRFFAGVALVDGGQFDALASGFLDLCGQFTDLRAFLRVGGCDGDRQQWPSVSTATWTLLAFLRLYPS